MNSVVKIIPQNSHRFRDGDREMLFHVPTSSVFELDQASSAALESPNASDVDEALLDDFQALQIVGRDSSEKSTIPDIGDLPLATLVLNVNTGCNLSCSYCYKEDLDTPANSQRMSFDTAKGSIEILIAESPDQPRYNLVFFGGEPLTNMPLIKEVVAYAEHRFESLGKPVDFSLTTNATMLTPEIVDFFQQHRIGVAISMDGPETIHNKNRITVGGQGTYHVVRRKVDYLLQNYNARPVGARVTLTKGTTDIEAIWDHLKNEVGFDEVGFAPVTSGDVSDYNLPEDELQQVFDNMKALGQRYIDAACNNINIGLSNFHQILTDIHEGTKKALPCGAGVGMVAIDHAGGVNLCHRFTGSDLPLFGSVSSGLDTDGLKAFLSERLDRADKGCNTCWIRNLCSGGCYHESYARYNDPQQPTYHYCDLMRDWIDFALQGYARIMRENPEFIARVIAPRRGTQ
jgi:uncharacterized protein